MSDFYVVESADSESVVICERHPGGELPFATVFPGVPMSAPARAEVRALARARAFCSGDPKARIARSMVEASIRSRRIEASLRQAAWFESGS